MLRPWPLPNTSSHLYIFFSHTHSHIFTSFCRVSNQVELQELFLFQWLQFIIEKSRMWKTQRHKHYWKTKDINCNVNPRDTFWFTISNSYSLWWSLADILKFFENIINRSLPTLPMFWVKSLAEWLFEIAIGWNNLKLGLGLGLRQCQRFPFTGIGYILVFAFHAQPTKSWVEVERLGEGGNSTDPLMSRLYSCMTQQQFCCGFEGFK